MRKLHRSWMALAGLLCALGAAAGNAPAATDRTYVVGVEDLKYYPLHSFRNGNFEGAASAILDAFAASRGYRFTYLRLPIARLRAEFAAADTVDFKYPDDESWYVDDRTQARVAFSKPIIDYTDGMMVRPAIKGRGKASIASIAVPLGFVIPGGLIGEQITITLAPNVESALKMASYGRVDAAYLNVTVARYLEREIGDGTRLVFDPSLPSHTGSYRLSSINHPEVIAEFDTFLRSDRKTVERIKHRFGVDTK